MKAVTLRNLVKTFGKTQVIHGINLEIEDTEFIVLVGPSGCGKSTILRMVAGLEEITEGEILIKDKVVNKLAPKDRNVAMVFQNYALYPHMNVFNNMAFGLKLQKTPKQEIEERVNNAAKILNISELLTRKPVQLSGGQRQRVAMGRAIVRNPDIYLFDEPLSNLDAKLRTQMRIEIKELHQRVKNTIIYVTHDQVEAMTLGDRIVVLRDGHIEQIGKPMELFQNPTNIFVAGFIGNPPMNLTEAEVTGEDTDLGLRLSNGRTIDISHRSNTKVQPGQKVIMGLRLEDITPQDENTELPAEWTIDAIVDVVEPLGNETHMHLDLDGIKMTGRCSGIKKISHNEKIKLAMNLNHLHIFDAQTQKVISS